MYVAGWLPARRRPVVAGTVVFVLAALAFRLVRRSAHFWGIDDSAITYAAAFELADHHSLAPYLEGTPIEGYSNPLLFFVVALLRLVGLFDPVTTHLRLEMIVFGGMVTLVWSLLRPYAGELGAVVGAAAFAAAELLTPATWIWYGAGLENVWVSAGLVALLWICVRTMRGTELRAAWGIVPALVAITRPEAPVYVVAFYGALIAFARPAETSKRAHLARIVRAGAITAALYAAFLLWRRLAYSAWLPNTYYAKLYGKHHLRDNLRDYVFAAIFPYCRSILFASTALVLLVMRRTEQLAQCLIVFLIAALALPITAGADWMGEHRFATAFIAVSHLCYAALAATYLADLRATPRSEWRRAQGVMCAVLAAMLVLFWLDGVPGRSPIPLNPVTATKIAEQRGGERWEHQMRLGVVFPVVINPDAGGALLVGGMQMLDNGYLTDFHMPRIRRRFGLDRDRRVLDQYQHEERRPDLVNDNNQFALDGTYLAARYVRGPYGLYARRDLVSVASLDPAAKLLLDDGHVKVYLSPETVAVAAPGGLVRCEVIVAWTDIAIDARTRVQGTVERGDRDEIPLEPYEAGTSGMERRALLLGAPATPGSYQVTLELDRDDGPPISTLAFTLEVTTDAARLAAVAGGLAVSGTAAQGAARVAWLREQQVRRLGMTAFHKLLVQMLRWDRHHGAPSGAAILQLRDNARLATLEDLPQGIRTAELVAIRRMFARCEPATALCLGRTIDELRRLGYLGVLDRVPEVARELDDAKARLGSASLEERYRLLVGITLADPSSVRYQWQLLKVRRELSLRPDFPSL